MKLRTLAHFYNKHTLILNGVTWEELLTYRSSNHHYFYINMLSATYETGATDGIKECKLVSVDTSDDIPHTDIIFESNGEKFHLDFNEPIVDEIVLLTISKNPDNEYYPFQIEFSYA